MVEDQQTQSLPDDDDGLRSLARLPRLSRRGPVRARPRAHLRRVERHYAELFEEAAGARRRRAISSSPAASTIPRRSRRLRELGFTRRRARCRRWCAPGTTAATARRAAQRARELLTELMPALLAALRRDRRSRRGVRRASTSSCAACPPACSCSRCSIRTRGCSTCSPRSWAAPRRWPQRLSRRPVAARRRAHRRILRRRCPTARALAEDLDAALDQARDFQDMLDIARRWANDHKFQIGVRMLRGATDVGSRRARRSRDIADAVIAALQPRRRDRVRAAPRRASRAPAWRSSALGKLGSREMTVDVRSRPDLRLSSADGARHVGRRASAGAQSTITRGSSQRLINAATAPTGEGRLYEVDMRLRPSGNAGPIASSLAASRAITTSRPGPGSTWR